jgi:hypothetical protein
MTLPWKRRALALVVSPALLAGAATISLGGALATAPAASAYDRASLSGDRETVLDRPFADDSPWNTPIPAGADFWSTSTFRGDPGWVNLNESSIPVYFGSWSDPVLTVRTPRGTFQVHAPASLSPVSGSDRTVTVVDLTNRTVTDFWQLYRRGGTSFGASLGIQTSLDGAGFGTGRTKAGVRSSGASALGGLITGANLRDGRIDHALAIAASSTDLSGSFVYPAVSTDSGAKYSNRGSLPMGTRIGIPRGTPKPAGLSRIGSMVWDAFTQYGGYLVDRTGGFALFADPKSVSQSDVDPLHAWWDGGSDLQLIIPRLQVVAG